MSVSVCDDGSVQVRVIVLTTIFIFMAILGSSIWVVLRFSLFHLTRDLLFFAFCLCVWLTISWFSLFFRSCSLFLILMIWVTFFFWRFRLVFSRDCRLLDDSGRDWVVDVSSCIWIFCLWSHFYVVLGLFRSHVLSPYHLTLSFCRGGIVTILCLCYLGEGVFFSVILADISNSCWTTSLFFFTTIVGPEAPHLQELPLVIWVRFVLWGSAPSCFGLTT